jgi:diguanylate cyclase (GGDEF)-like protein/PAS domain S-box-containing protein
MAEKQKPRRQPSQKKAQAAAGKKSGKEKDCIFLSNSRQSNLSSRSELLAAVINALPDIAFVIDEDGVYIEAYTSPSNFHYHDLDGIKGSTIEKLSPSKECAERHMRVLQAALESGQIQILEYEYPNSSGMGWYEGRVAPVEKTFGDKRHVVWLARDITHQRAAMEELRKYQQNLEAAVEERAAEIIKANANLMREKESREMMERMLVERQDYLDRIINSILAMVYVRSTDSVFTLVSSKYAEFFELSRYDILGNTPDGVFLPEIAENMLENDRRIMDTGVMNELEYWYDINGERRYVIERAIPLMDDARGHPIAICGTVVDVTESKKREEYVTHLALHDTLTGLANRQFVMDRLGKAISDSKRANLSVALLFIDLDFFKAINDTLGHEAGDVVLIETAKRFCTCVRKGDTVGRFGGDEFVIILENVRSRDDIEETIKNIFGIVGQPIPFMGHECVVGASVGVSICPEHAGDIDALLTCADDAMYAVKKKGKNNYTYYQPPETKAE